MKPMTRRGFLISSLCLTVASCLKVAPQSPPDFHAHVAAEFPHFPVGMIMPWCASEAPEGWIECDGRILWRSEYPKLFQVTGTQFGRDLFGRMFRVPDLSKETPFYAEFGRQGGHQAMHTVIQQSLADKHLRQFYIMKAV